MGNNASSDIEMARFCTHFLLLENYAKYCLDPEPETKLSKVATGTATHHLIRALQKYMTGDNILKALTIS